MNIDELKALRRRNWRQDGERLLATSDDAAPFIEEVGIATLYAASPEFPSLMLAHVGKESYVADAKWDSPSGFVYGWRWELGRPAAAFYTSIVAKKPTWVSWSLLPIVLAALMTRRDPEELYEAGELTRDGLRVYQALRAAPGLMSTGDLRASAGFPKGKESRAAYLKAVEELESHLLLAKVFACDGSGDEMCHSAIADRYPEVVESALSLSREHAIRSLLSNQLDHSAFVDPATFSRHLRLPAALVEGSLTELGARPLSDGKRTIYALEN